LGVQIFRKLKQGAPPQKTLQNTAV